MERFIILKNMRDYPCYSNVNARLVYLHAACQMDLSTYTCAKSLRQMAKELGIGLEAVRHAVRQLERDGLIATHVATQTCTHPTTYLTTQQTTHLTILKANENGAPNGAPNNTPNNTPSNTPCNTLCNTQNKVSVSGLEESPTHSPARVDWSKKAEELGKVLKLEAAQAADLTNQFRERQEIKGKSWESDGDLLAHLISWVEKRLPLQPANRKAPKMSDAQARQMEYQRSAEVAAQETEQEKELRLVKYAWADYCAKVRKEGEDKAVSEKKNYIFKRQAYEEKFGKISAS